MRCQPLWCRIVWYENLWDYFSTRRGVRGRAICSARDCPKLRRPFLLRTRGDERFCEMMSWKIPAPFLIMSWVCCSPSSLPFMCIVSASDELPVDQTISVTKRHSVVSLVTWRDQYLPPCSDLLDISGSLNYCPPVLHVIWSLWSIVQHRPTFSLSTYNNLLLADTFSSPTSYRHRVKNNLCMSCKQLIEDQSTQIILENVSKCHENV